MDILKFGFKYYRKHIPLALIALLMGFCLIGVALTMPLLSKIIIDYVIIPAAGEQVVYQSGDGGIFDFLLLGGYGEYGSIQLMLSIASLSVILMAVKHILLYSRNNLHLVYGFKYEKFLKIMTFKKLLSSSNAVLSRYNTGELMTVLSQDTVLFRDLYMRTIPNTLDALVFIVLSVIFLFGIYPPLALLPLTVLPFQLVLFVRYLKKAKLIHSAIRNSQSALSMTVQENINGIRIVRSFAAEDYELKKFDKVSSGCKKVYFDHADFVTKYGLGFNTLRHLLYMICIAAGGSLVISGTIGLGGFLAFITYVFIILDSTTNIINLMFEFQSYLVSGERIMNFISTGNIIDTPQNPIPLPSPPHIKLNNVSLSIDGKVILDDINIDIPYGKKLGVMGDTGSGKTSLLNILTRLTDPLTGCVTVNGVDIKEADLEQVRGIYGYVLQDVFLFSNTIDANIALYDPDMPSEDVKKYAVISQADDFIMKMEEGYSTIVGERGIGLSGGQKQRISAARAFAKNAPVLMLDDVTSALDTETERKLIKNIYSEFKEKTVIITAHRASSVKECDEIIFLSEGRIVERGTHSDLMSFCGRYFEICRQQSADTAE